MSSFKTIILSPIRNLFKIPFLEKWILKKTNGKEYTNFFVKLLPSNRTYKKESYRNAERGNIKYRLDISDYMEYTLYFGIEVESRATLLSLIKEDMVILDIGTNIGETLLNFAKINTKGINYGFEPVPYLYQRAKHNIGLNNFDNIILNNIALSDKKEQLFFSIPNNNNSGGIAMSKNAQQGMLEVGAMTLDSFVANQNIDKIHFIKIDVEGFEMNVLKGGSETLTKMKPQMFIELVDNHLKRQNTSSKEVILFLKNIGYEIYHAQTKEKINENFNFQNTHFDIICY
ncbi:MAG: FkbM family methyltransferase [Cytophagales bacterium]|nr:MAG: FkbM family methyltransferase [Cytophagales bacterium]